MAEQVKDVPFVSTATIYLPGGGHPFPPGSTVSLHPDHASEFRKHGIERAIRTPVEEVIEQKDDEGSQGSRSSAKRS